MGKKTAHSTGICKSPAAKVTNNKQNEGGESDSGSDRGSEKRPVSNKELRLIRQECREVAGRLKQFTGKAAEGSLAGHRLKVKEICEDHGWVDGPGFYYVTRYSVTEEVWSDVKDLLEGEPFDRHSYEGYFRRAARVWEALKVLYSNLITREMLRENWAALTRLQGESCSTFVKRVNRMRKEIKGEGIELTDEEELGVLRSGLGEPYTEWLAQEISHYMFDSSSITMPKIRTMMSLRGDEWENRHGGPSPVKRSGKVDTTRLQPTRTTEDKRSIPCRDLITNGSCAYDKACKFSHDLKSFPCRRLSQYGTCSYGDACKFKHDKGAKPSNAGVCYEFNKTGKCSRNNCKFSHVTEETKEATNAVLDDSEDSDDGIFMMTDNEPKKGKRTLTLEVEIEGMKQKALVDTGSTVNLMSMEKMKELQLRLKKEDKTLRLADRRRLELVGSTTTTVRVSGEQCGREKEMTFFIAEKLARPIILGLEGLQKLEVQIKLRQGYEPCIISVDHDSKKKWLGSVEDQPLDGLVCGVSLDSISYNEKTLDPPSTTGVGEEIGGDEAEKMNDECEDKIEEEEPAVKKEGREEQLKFSAVKKEGREEQLKFSAVKKEGREEQLKFSDEMPLTKEGRRYVLQLPWRNEDRPKRNLTEAVKRAKALEKRMSEAEKIRVQEEIHRLLEEGIIEAVDEEEIRYFVPITPVFKETSVSTKTRLTVDGRRLNNFLRVGSVEGQQPLSEVLTAFRTSQHFVGLDLLRAFNQVRMHNESKRWLGFTLFDGWFVWAMMPFGLSSSPATLYQSLSLALKENNGTITMPYCYYVDDFGVRAQAVADLVHNEEVLTQRLEKSSFPTQPKKRISSEDKEDKEVKHLGYRWKLPEDTIGQVLAAVDIPEEMTKAELVGYYARWYDLLGLFLPVGIAARMRIQEAHALVKEWQEKVPLKCIAELKRWATTVRSREWKVPRSLNTDAVVVYADASLDAWAAEVYATTYEESDRQLHILFGSGGVFAKQCGWSVPKRELFALWQAAKLAVKAKQAGERWEPKVRKVVICSDSAINIWRMKRSKQDVKISKIEKKWLEEIEKLCEAVDARIIHVPSASNLADKSTRGDMCSNISVTIHEIDALVSGAALVSYGPSITRRSKNAKEDSDEEDPSVVFPDFDLCALASEEPDEEEEVTEPIRGVDDTFNDSFVEPINFIPLIRENQNKCLYISLLKQLITDNTIPVDSEIPRSILEKQKGLYDIENGLLVRCVRRNTEGELCVQLCIDSSDSQLTNLIIDYVHDKAGHLGSPKIAEAVAQEYFWKGMKAAVKKRLKTCDICQRRKAKVAYRRTSNEIASVRMLGLKPGAVWGVDHVTNLPAGKFGDGRDAGNYVAILVILDAMTKFCWMRPVKSTILSESLRVLEELSGTVGYPRLIVTDSHSSFKAPGFRRWALMRAIKTASLPPNSKAYGGWYERCHLSIKQLFTTRVGQGLNFDHWPCWLPSANLIYNCTNFAGLDICPADLFYSYRIARPWETRRNESIDGDDSNMEAISAGIKHLIDEPEESLLSDMFKKQMDERKLKYRAYAEFWEAMKDIQQEMLHKRRAYCRGTEPFAVGDEVLVFRPYSGKGAGLKYHIQFVGPFTIKEVLSPSVRLLDTQSHGGWGGRDIIPKQLVHNLVRYYRREDEEEGLYHWIQCDTCAQWQSVDSVLMQRFAPAHAKFYCRLVGRECRRDCDIDHNGERNNVG